MCDIIVFENLRFRPSTRKRKAGVFKKSPLWRAFLKRCVFGDCFHMIRVDGRPNWRKKISVFKQKRIRVYGGPKLLIQHRDMLCYYHVRLLYMRLEAM